MFQALDRNPLLGNLLLALIFGGLMFAITFKFFEGHPQMMLYLGLSAFGMLVFFAAGVAHDRDHARPTIENTYLEPRHARSAPQSTVQAAPIRQRQRELEYARY